MAGIFGEFFLVSVPTKRSTKNPRKIRGKFGAKFGAKSGTKIEKFGKLSFCNFSDLTNSPIRHRHPPGPAAPPLLETPPPLWDFQKKNRTPTTSQRLGLPLPPPRAEKKIKKNIRNVHQGLYRIRSEAPAQNAQN